LSDARRSSTEGKKKTRKMERRNGRLNEEKTKEKIFRVRSCKTLLEKKKKQKKNKNKRKTKTKKQNKKTKNS
jgi:hypothetical protein